MIIHIQEMKGLIFRCCNGCALHSMKVKHTSDSIFKIMKKIQTGPASSIYMSSCATHEHSSKHLVSSIAQSLRVSRARDHNPGNYKMKI